MLRSTAVLRRVALVAAGVSSLVAIPAQERAQPRARDPEANLWNCTGSPAALPKADPAGGEVPLPKAHPDWNAFHLFTSDTWRLHAIGAGHVTRPDGPPEVLFMDELGRAILLTGDSGKYSPRLLVEDSSSMSAWALGDLDPRVPGAELYIGGGSGKVHRVNAVRARRRWDPADATSAAPSDAVGSVDGASLSKFVLGDIDPAHPGNEMLALTNNGPVFDVRPDPNDMKGFVLDKIGDLGSRCRDAVLLPATAARPPRVAALLESGEVALLVRTKEGYSKESLCKEPMSIARLGRRKEVAGELEVVYVARIDGLILRFAEQPDGTWRREPIFAGPNGPRGLAAGRFDIDPTHETLAVFGYSRKVHLLRKRPGAAWEVETIFVDTGGGHWLTAGELDGRNTTDELVGGGFGYHVFLLTRTPGAGYEGIAVDPDHGVIDYPLPEREPRVAIGTPVAAAAARGAGKLAAASPLATGAPADAVLTAAFESDGVGDVPSGFVAAETRGAGTPARWQVVAGLAADGARRVAIAETKNRGSTFNLLLHTTTCPADLAVECALRPESGDEDRGGGLVWRAQGPDDYYVARWNPLETNLRVYKVVGGERTMLDSCVVQCDAERWHRLSVTMRGRRGTVAFDGAPCLSFEDATFTGPGRIGLWTKADAATSFDGLVVRPLAREGESAPR